MLCRSGVAIPLTDDHKAAREDETVRITTENVVQDPLMPSRVVLRGLQQALASADTSISVMHTIAGHEHTRVTMGWHGTDTPCVRVEQARVEAAGGQILFWNGVRVMGVLAVSRAIGDHCLRPFVIAQPEVST